jgi:hypothetical protein
MAGFLGRRPDLCRNIYEVSNSHSDDWFPKCIYNELRLMMTDVFHLLIKINAGSDNNISSPKVLVKKSSTSRLSKETKMETKHLPDTDPSTSHVQSIERVPSFLDGRTVKHRAI